MDVMILGVVVEESSGDVLMVWVVIVVCFQGQWCWCVASSCVVDVKGGFVGGGRVVLQCWQCCGGGGGGGRDVHIVQVRHSCYVTSMQRKKSYSTLQSVH